MLTFVSMCCKAKIRRRFSTCLEDGVIEVDEGEPVCSKCGQICDIVEVETVEE